jgi:hypothetical protein
MPLPSTLTFICTWLYLTTSMLCLQAASIRPSIWGEIISMTSLPMRTAWLSTNESNLTPMISTTMWRSCKQILRWTMPPFVICSCPHCKSGARSYKTLLPNVMKTCPLPTQMRLHMWRT